MSPVCARVPSPPPGLRYSHQTPRPSSRAPARPSVPASIGVLSIYFISFLWLKIFAAHLLEGGGRPNGAALVPEEDAAAGHQHGAAHQAEQPGPLELGGEAGLVVVLTEPVIVMSLS